MDSLHAFRISIKAVPTPQFGYLVNPNKAVHILMTEISRRAIAIMKTNRARSALRTLGERWSEEHKQNLYCDAAVSSFQCLLAKAEIDPLQWLLLVMNWTIKGDTKVAEYHRPISPMLGTDCGYPIQNDSIHLSGVVSWLPIFFKRCGTSGIRLSKCSACTVLHRTSLERAQKDMFACSSLSGVIFMRLAICLSRS